MIRRFLVFVLIAAASAANADGLKIVVISDLNGGYGSTEYSVDVDRAISRVIELSPDLVISTGDMVAGQQRNPHLTQTEVDEMWAAFDQAVTQPLKTAGIPLLVTPGNHDASAYHGFESERETYLRLWGARVPDLKFIDADKFPFRYAVSDHGVLLVSLDVTMTGPLSKSEMKWLLDLLDNQSSKHVATIVFSHLPIWPFAQGRETEIIGDKALQDLLESKGVDLYLSGHHHAYYPGMMNGILYISQACLGNGPRRLISSSAKSQKAITVVEVDEKGGIEEYALSSPDYMERIELKQLPKSLQAGNDIMVRHDLAQR